jgi:hypothetical protein
MVNRLLRPQIPAQEAFHDEDVLEDIGSLDRSRMIRDSDDDVASFVPRATSLPIAVELLRIRSASPTCA